MMIDTPVMPIDTLEVSADTLEIPTDTVAVVVPPATAHAFIVGGCFSVEQNALNMTTDARAQGCAEAFVMQYGTMYYVCYGQYAAVEEAKAALNDILLHFNKKAWILKK